jgi:hypothetical protein
MSVSNTITVMDSEALCSFMFEERKNCMIAATIAYMLAETTLILMTAEEKNGIRCTIRVARSNDERSDLGHNFETFQSMENVIVRPYSIGNGAFGAFATIYPNRGKNFRHVEPKSNLVKTRELLFSPIRINEFERQWSVSDLPIRNKRFRSAVTCVSFYNGLLSIVDNTDVDKTRIITYDGEKSIILKMYFDSNGDIMKGSAGPEDIHLWSRDTQISRGKNGLYILERSNCALILVTNNGEYVLLISKRNPPTGNCFGCHAWPECEEALSVKYTCFALDTERELMYIAERNPDPCSMTSAGHMYGCSGWLSNGHIINIFSTRGGKLEKVGHVPGVYGKVRCMTIRNTNGTLYFSELVVGKLLETEYRERRRTAVYIIVRTFMELTVRH